MTNVIFKRLLTFTGLRTSKIIAIRNPSRPRPRPHKRKRQRDNEKMRRPSSIDNLVDNCKLLIFHQLI